MIHDVEAINFLYLVYANYRFNILSIILYYLSIYHLSIYLSIYQSINLSIYQSIYLYLSICLSKYDIITYMMIDIDKHECIAKRRHD